MVSDTFNSYLLQFGWWSINQARQFNQRSKTFRVAATIVSAVLLAAALLLMGLVPLLLAHFIVCGSVLLHQPLVVGLLAGWKVASVQKKDLERRTLQQEKSLKETVNIQSLEGTDPTDQTTHQS